MEMKIAHTHIFVIYQHSLAVFINCWVLARPLKWLALFKVQPAKKKNREGWQRCEGWQLSLFLSLDIIRNAAAYGNQLKSLPRSERERETARKNKYL